MELFKITCVTCQAGLSVRNKALLGQIVACPRCGSMVEVAAPTKTVANGTVADATVADATTVAGADFGEPSAAAQTDRTSAASASVTDPPPVEVPEQGAAGPADAAQSSPVGEFLEASREVAIPAAEAALPVANAEALQASAAVAKYQLIVWSLTSFLIGAAVVGFVLLSRGDPSTEATPVAAESTPRTDIDLPAETTPAVTDLPDTVEAPLADAPATSLAEPELAEPELPASASEDSPTAEADGVSAPQPQSLPLERPRPDSLAPLSAPLSPAVTPDGAPRLARRLDPLDWDPESLSLATVDPPADHGAVAARPALLETSPTETSPVADFSEEVPSTLPLVRRGPVGDPADANRSAPAKQLALLIPAVKVDQLPLLDCLRLFSQLCGVPVSVAPEQLLMAGINSQKKVSLQGSDISVDAMLTQLLQPLRLAHEVRGAQVVVVRQEASKIREISYPIDDLLVASTGATQLAGWVEQLVAPSTWQGAGGEGTLEMSADRLRVKQTQQVQYQVLILLEQIRLARNLPPRSRYPVERLASTAVHRSLHEKLAAPTTFTFLQYTALNEVFVHWQTEIGVPLLIDWPALASAELWPASTIACAIIDQPWHIALENILEPLGLGWRVATGGSMEITSAHKVQNESQLRLYPLRRELNGDGEAMLNQLRALARQQSAEVTSAILYDPVGKIVLSYQPAATQRLLQQQLQRDQLLIDD